MSERLQPLLLQEDTVTHLERLTTACRNPRFASEVFSIFAKEWRVVDAEHQDEKKLFRMPPVPSMGLGYCFLQGWGQERNTVVAKALWRPHAANQHLAEAFAKVTHIVVPEPGPALDAATVAAVVAALCSDTIFDELKAVARDEETTGATNSQHLLRSLIACCSNQPDDAASLIGLAFCFSGFFDEGTPPMWKKRVVEALLVEAMARDDVRARFELGRFYASGSVFHHQRLTSSEFIGTYRREGVRLVEQAADRGHPAATAWFEERIKKERAQMIANAEASKFEQEQGHHYGCHAGLGSAHCAYMMGMFLTYGLEQLTINHERAAYWFAQSGRSGPGKFPNEFMHDAIVQGNGKAMAKLAHCYDKGLRGCPQSDGLANHWYEQAASHGCPGDPRRYKWQEFR